MAGSKAWNPVMLPPGRARLATKPLSTGSPTCENTIGIVRVSPLELGQGRTGRDHDHIRP